MRKEDRVRGSQQQSDQQQQPDKRSQPEPRQGEQVKGRGSSGEPRQQSQRQPGKLPLPD